MISPLAAGRDALGQGEQLRLGVVAEVGRERLAGPRSTTPPLLIAPPTTHRPGVSA